MAGTAWKATGVVLLVIGIAVGLLGIGAAVLGGVMFSDTMSDAQQCQSSLFNRCDEDVYGARAEASAIAAMAGGGAFVLGLVLALIGAILLVVGGRRAQKAMQAPR